MIEILGETLECFDNDRIIPAFGFGDYERKEEGLFALNEEVRRGSINLLIVLIGFLSCFPLVKLVKCN